MKQNNYLLQKTEFKLTAYNQKLKLFPENQIIRFKINLLEVIKDYLMEKIKNEEC